MKELLKEVPVLAIVMISIIAYALILITNNHNSNQEKYDEMKYKLDSVSYEYYRLQNKLTEDVMDRDSSWIAEHKTDE